MKNKIIISLFGVTLLFGLTGCSDSKSVTNGTRPNSFVTEQTDDKAQEAEPSASDDNLQPTETVENTQTSETATQVTGNENTAKESSNKLSTYYEPIGTLEDTYEFGASYIETVMSKDQIANYAKEHNLTDYEVADCNGSECYLICPKYEDASIRIDLLADVEQTQGETILTTNKPVFVLCNPSDIWSNAQIIVINNGKEFEFAPYISLKDGTPVLPSEANTKQN